MARFLRAALIAPTLVLAHQLVFLARYGSVYGEALAHSGHGQAWTDAVTTVTVGSGAVLIATLIGLFRLARELRRVTARTDASLEPPDARAARSLLAGWLRLAAALTIVGLVGLTIQENVEHIAAGLDAPGIGVLLSRDYPSAVKIVAAVSLAIALLATLLGWRGAALVARLRALTARHPRRHRGRTIPLPSTEQALLPSGALARQLGRRAPPVALPA
jgi:hypothetical protein